MRCPNCGEIANFLHFRSVEYVAPVVLKDGEITIKRNREILNETDDDEDACHCGKCHRKVSFDEIEIVEMENEGA